MPGFGPGTANVIMTLTVGVTGMLSHVRTHDAYHPPQLLTLSLTPTFITNLKHNAKSIRNSQVSMPLINVAAQHTLQVT